MSKIFDVVIRFAENTLRVFNKEGSAEDLDTEDENIIDSMRKEFKNNHMTRLNEWICTVDAGIMYVDILNNLEKAGDHTFNVAQIVKGDLI